MDTRHKDKRCPSSEVDSVKSADTIHLGAREIFFVTFRPLFNHLVIIQPGFFVRCRADKMLSSKEWRSVSLITTLIVILAIDSAEIDSAH